MSVKWILFYLTEAEESNGTISSEEDLEHLEYSKSFVLKPTVAKKSISQIIKDKKKQTQLTLQWYFVEFLQADVTPLCKITVRTPLPEKHLSIFFILAFCQLGLRKTISSVKESACPDASSTRIIWTSVGRRSWILLVLPLLEK